MNPRVTRCVPWSRFSLGSACTYVQVWVRLLDTISPASCSHWAQDVSDTGPQGVPCMDKGIQNSTEESSNSWVQWVTQNPYTHPKGKKFVWTQFNMCFCSSETLPVLRCNWGVFCTPYTWFVLKEMVSVPNPARLTDLSGFSLKASFQWPRQLLPTWIFIPCPSTLEEAFCSVTITLLWGGRFKSRLLLLTTPVPSVWHVLGVK